VGGEQDRSAAGLEAFDQLPELPAGLGIEPRGGLVEKEEPGIAHQGTRQREALPLPAGKLAHSGAGLLLQLDQRNDVAGGGARAVEAAEEGDRLRHRELLGELGFLERDTQQLAQLAVVPAPAVAEHEHLAAVRLGQSLADLDRGGLAGAVRAQQAETLAGPDLQIDPVHCDDVAIALAKPAHEQRRGSRGRR